MAVGRRLPLPSPAFHCVQQRMGKASSAVSHAATPPTDHASAAAMCGLLCLFRLAFAIFKVFSLYVFYSQVITTSLERKLDGEKPREKLVRICCIDSARMNQYDLRYGDPNSYSERRSDFGVPSHDIGGGGGGAAGNGGGIGVFSGFPNMGRGGVVPYGGPMGGFVATTAGTATGISTGPVPLPVPLLVIEDLLLMLSIASSSP